VIFIVAFGPELGKRVDLSVGDMAAGRLAAGPGWLIAPTSAFGDYGS